MSRARSTRSNGRLVAKSVEVRVRQLHAEELRVRDVQRFDRLVLVEVGHLGHATQVAEVVTEDPIGVGQNLLGLSVAIGDQDVAADAPDRRVDWSVQLTAPIGVGPPLGCREVDGDEVGRDRNHVHLRDVPRGRPSW